MDEEKSKTVVLVLSRKTERSNLIARSQAKNLIKHFENFKVVVLDFEGVDEIGQAFADQLFRVFANANPEIHLEAVNTTEAVQKMISRAIHHISSTYTLSL